MAADYDMYAEYFVLCEISDKLKKIGYNLNNSVAAMDRALNSNGEFLSGEQFEKARSTTSSCISITQRTEKNIINAINYIEKLKNQLEDYNKCGYSGDA